MKKKVFFWLVLALPLIVLAGLNWEKSISSAQFFWMMMIYAFFYHPFICALRLIALKRMSTEKLWMCVIPLWNWKYSTDAVFGAGK